jgi:hypothetical protein
MNSKMDPATGRMPGAEARDNFRPQNSHEQS